MRCSSCSKILKPVVGVDIDGTLGDYHAHFIDFAREYLDQELWNAYDYDGSMEFSEWLGLEKYVYREIKLAYRQGGLKRSMPIFNGASEMMSSFREAGAEVWIATTRPFDRLDNIDPDTKEWLRRHDVHFDGLLYGDDKYHKLLELVDKERVVGVIEDQLEMVRQAKDLGLPAFHRRTHWNTYTRELGWTDRGLEYIKSIFLERIRAWQT